ncbi:PhzF family phenazine biosynthesis protein [Mucilaginibacter sp. UC70_90]
MKKLPYYILDVFTHQPYKGNPLSVVWCDDELELSQYYNIAREFGYSETSFVWYSDAEKLFKVRSFTPAIMRLAAAVIICWALYPWLCLKNGIFLTARVLSIG